MTRCRGLSSWLAAGWAGAFAVLHVFWALGGSAGLASSAGAELARDRPVWFVAAGLWGVAVLLLIAGTLALALRRSSRRLLVVAGGLIGGLLLVRGLGIEVLLLTGAYEGNDDITAVQRHWSLVLWNPWFVLGGVAFALAACSAAGAGRGIRDRRWWARARG